MLRGPQKKVVKYQFQEISETSQPSSDRELISQKLSKPPSHNKNLTHNNKNPAASDVENGPNLSSTRIGKYLSRQRIRTEPAQTQVFSWCKNDQTFTIEQKAQILGGGPVARIPQPQKIKGGRLIHQIDKLEQQFNTQPLKTHLTPLRCRSTKTSSVVTVHLPQLSARGLPEKVYRLRNGRDSIEKQPKIAKEDLIRSRDSLNFGFMKDEDSIVLQNNEFIQDRVTSSIFKKLYYSIPPSLTERTQESVRNFVYLLHKNNPLFKKLQYLSCVELIKNNQISIFGKGQIIYAKRSRCQQSFIILWGSVQEYNSDEQMEMCYRIGSTLSEEYFLQEKRDKRRTHSSFSLEESGVLVVTLAGLEHFKQELLKLYLKKDLLTLESVFKKNYYNKRSLRESKRIRAKKSMEK